MFTPRSFAIARQRLVGLAVGSAAAIAMACALVPVGAQAAAPGDPIPLFVPAALPPTEAVAAAAAAFGSDSEIRNRLDTPGGLVVGGEKLRVALLRQFYAAHYFEPVWQSRQAQADALLRAVRRADEHGLDPDLFHAALLRNPASLPPLERELLLSSAFLGYADALARGAVPVETRTDNETLSPEPVDVAAVLTQAIGSHDPAVVIEGLAPRSPSYMALRRALQTQLEVAGEARVSRGSGSGKMADGRLRTLVVNLERQRWLPRQLPADRVWVNTIDSQLTFYRADRPIFTTRVIVGQPGTENQTPDMQTPITGLVFNPPWNVPYSIVTKEILPKMSRDPGYLSRRRMVMRPNGGIQQLPGPGGTALGHLKFEMPNRHDVYLHDTPNKELFSRDNRRLSHGCVRVQNPRELGALLLQQPVEAINNGIAGGATAHRMLAASIPVFLVYQTAFVDAHGTIAFRPDVYDRDDRIWRRLQPLRQAPVAQHEPKGERRG